MAGVKRRCADCGVGYMSARLVTKDKRIVCADEATCKARKERLKGVRSA